MILNLEKKLDKLKDYFAKREEVLMAFAFGSNITGRATTESDFDIAVYFKPKMKEMEWEEEKEYETEDEVWADVEKIVGIRTDFIVLNRAPSTFAFSIIQNGKPIIIKDKSFYTRFYLLISSAAEYFMEFTKDFWAIKQRSNSLSEIDRQRLIRIADFFEKEIEDYKNFKDISQKDYESDTALKRNIERWAENIVNSSIDIAKITLASEKINIPETYRETLRSLSKIKDFDADIAENLSKYAKMRNILAHEYLDIRFKQLKNFTNESETAYRYLLGFVKKMI